MAGGARAAGDAADINKLESKLFRAFLLLLFPESSVHPQLFVPGLKECPHPRTNLRATLLAMRLGIGAVLPLLLLDL